jgi:hypothetical protein
MPSYQKYASSATNPEVDHATILELKKLGSEIRQINKQLVNFKLCFVHSLTLNFRTLSCTAVNWVPTTIHQ